jgi:hypothetical protein
MSLPETHWQCKLHDGSSWIYNIPNPGEQEIALITESTMQIVNLANGSQATITPTTTYRYQPIKFRITGAQDPTTILNIETFIKNAIEANYHLDLITHTDETITGRFQRVSRAYMLSGKTQKYYLDCDFLKIDV